MLLEPDGDLIANSSRAPLFSEQNGERRRLKAETVPQPLAREVAGLVQGMHASRTGSISTHVQDEQGRAYYLDIAPYVRGQDIRWYLVTVVPRADFAGPLDALWARFLWILLGGAGGTAGLSLVMAGWVTRPMRAINERVKQIAAGQFGSRVETRRQDEIGQLAHSFNDMSERLAGTYDEIQLSNAALDAANRELAALLSASGSAGWTRRRKGGAPTCSARRRPRCRKPRTTTACSGPCRARSCRPSPIGRSSRSRRREGKRGLPEPTANRKRSRCLRS